MIIKDKQGTTRENKEQHGKKGIEGRRKKDGLRKKKKEQ